MQIKEHSLYNFIGLRNASDWLPDSEQQTPPKSGYYVNALPGMSSELADKSRSREQVDVESFWDDVQQAAFAKLEQDVRLFIEEGALASGPMNFGQVIYQTRTPILDSVAITASEENRGVFIQLPRDKFVSLEIKNLYVYSASATTTDITIKDLGTEQVLFSFPDVALIAGLNIIPIEKTIGLEYGNRQIFISIDAAAVNSRLFKGEALHFHSDFYACHSCYSTSIGEDSVYIQPAVESLGVLTKVNQGYGVWVDAQVVCSMDSLLRENKKVLTRALWYQLGVKLLEYKFASPRLNYFTVSNKENMKETYDHLKREYERSIKLALISLTGSISKEDSLCLSCNPSTSAVSYGGMMP